MGYQGFLRRLKEACDLVGATCSAVPRADNVGKITLASGKVVFFNRVRWDLNTMGSSAVATDKDATSYFLRKAGFATPTGRAFTRGAILKPAQDIEPAFTYAQKLGLPVLLKPNGSYGSKNVAVAYTRSEFFAAAKAIFKGSNKLLVQRIVNGRDCSITVLDGQILMATEKTRPYVTGDGVTTVARLLTRLKAASNTSNRLNHLQLNDPRMRSHLKRSGIKLTSKPCKGERVELLPISNLGMGGDVRVVTDLLHPTLIDVALRAVATIGLRLASLDLIVSNPVEEPLGRYSILEINSGPGLDTFERKPGWSKRRVERIRQILIALERTT